MDVLTSAALADDADEIAIGAEAIARDCFHGQLITRQVYRLAEERTWPFFRLRGKLAMRPAAKRAEVARREAEAATRGRAA